MGVETRELPLLTALLCFAFAWAYEANFFTMVFAVEASLAGFDRLTDLCRPASRRARTECTRGTRIDAHLNSIDAGEERHPWASLSTIL